MSIPREKTKGNLLERAPRALDLPIHLLQQKVFQLHTVLLVSGRFR
jgi:hypothetical protein